MLIKSIFICSLLILGICGNTLGLPSLSGQYDLGVERDLAQRPNNVKKITFDDLDDINTNSIQEGSLAGFSWGNMISILMQMLLGSTNTTGPSKSDIDDSVPASPWTNFISMGLRFLTAILGVPQQQPDGIDKVDQSGSPLQGLLTAVLGAFLGQGRNPDQIAVIAGQASEFINIVMNLLDALKTSFSHRSNQIRSVEVRDPVSEIAGASIVMLKGYIKSVEASNNIEIEGGEQRDCTERALCEANAECTFNYKDSSNVICTLGSFATSYFLQDGHRINFQKLYEAGRRGRSGEDCKKIFVDCTH